MRESFSSQQVRRIILEQSYRARVGHIGSALSIADIITSLYTHILHIPDPHDPDRDRFILSKGHASLAVYAALYLQSWISFTELNTYCADATRLGVHPEWTLPGIDFSTGSLGQGLSMGAGAALAARLQKSARRVFVVISDAECNEGAVWEAVMFAAHHQLSQLVAIVDANGQQALGYTDAVLSMSPMAARWRAFGWDTREVEGHNVEAIAAAVASFDTCSGPPHVLIAHTTFGNGVSYMKGQIPWHYLPMSEAQYIQALDEVSKEL